MDWTNSKLYVIQQCGERYRRREIEKDLRPRRTPLVRGTVVHETIRPMVRRRLEDGARQLGTSVEHLGAQLTLSVADRHVLLSGALPTVEEVRDTAATAFAKEWIPDGIDFDEDEQSEGAAKVGDRIKDTAIDLATLYRTHVAPTLAPKGVEYRVTVRPKDSDLVIKGTIDLLADEGGDFITDVKSSEKSPDRHAAEDSQQLSLYSLIRYAQTKTIPAGLRLDYLVRTPAKHELKHVPLTTTRDREDMATIVERLNRATEAVQKGVFLGADPSAWWCRSCEYRGDCPLVRRSRRPEN